MGWGRRHIQLEVDIGIPFCFLSNTHDFTSSQYGVKRPHVCLVFSHHVFHFVFNKLGTHVMNASCHALAESGSMS